MRRFRLTPALRGPLASPDFRRLWIGEGVSIAGTQFHLVALPWIVLDVSGSGLALGSVLAAAALPRAALMLVGGALTDRFSPVRLLLVSNAARALLAGALALAVRAGDVPMPLLYAISGCFGLADALFYPAFMALVPRLVSSPQLPGANSLLQGTAQALGLLGPAVAGVVIAAFGPAVALAADAVSFLFSAVLVYGISAHAAQPAAAPENVVAGIRGVLGYVRAQRQLRTLLMAIAAINLTFVGPFIVGATALASERFAGGPAALGWLFSALAGGALAGTAIAAPLDRRSPGHGSVVLSGMWIIGIALMLLSRISDVGHAAAVIALAGLAAGALNPLILAWLQRATPAALQGRVMSLAMLGAVGLTPLSYVGAGVLVEYGADRMFLAAGALLIGLSLALLPALRRAA